MEEIKTSSTRTKIILVVVIVVLLLCCWGFMGLTAYQTNPDPIIPPTYSLSESQTRRAEAVPTYRTMRPTDVPTIPASEVEGTPVLTGTAVVTPTTTITATAVVSPTANDLTSLIETALVPGNRDIPRVTSATILSDTTISIQWAINNNLTEIMVADGAKLDIYNMLVAIHESQTAYQLIDLVGTYPQTDDGENLVESTAIHITYTPEVINAVDWATFTYLEVYTIANILEIHPAFAEQP